MAGVATALILRTLAAGPSIAVEPENGILSCNVKVGSDNNASNARYIQFGGASCTSPSPTPPPPTTSPPPPVASGSGPCGLTATAPAQYDHIIWITFENETASSIIGNSSLPNFNALANSCGYATNFHAETHPSLPNYIAMTSGSTQGITGDSSGMLNVDNLYNQVKQAGKQWRQYSFGMTGNCAKSDQPSGAAIYTAHHEAVIYYTNVSADCANWDVPVSSGKVDDTTDVTNSILQRDIDNGTLPALAVIGPSDDGGNSTVGGEVDPGIGDKFIKRWMDKITASNIYKAGKTAIFITWDENQDFSCGSNATANASLTGCNKGPIPTIVVAPSVPAGAKIATAYNHYSMLRATEEMLGINSFLGGASSATSMRTDFHL